VERHVLGPERFFRLEETPCGEWFPDGEPAWAILEGLPALIRRLVSPNASKIPRLSGMVTRTTALVGGEAVQADLEIVSWDASKGRLEARRKGKPLPDAAVVCAGAFLMDDEIEIGPGSLVEPGALIRGPARIGPACEVRQGAYLRGNVLAGAGCVLGHATEVKNAVFLDGAKAGHFAYVGDSVLGSGANLGAGTKLANLKIIGGAIRIRTREGEVDTGRRKLGAILGDGTETGCNAVLSPGTLLVPKSMVYPNTTVPSGAHLGKRIFRVRS